MNKSEAIQRFAQKVLSEIGFDKAKISDHWDSDLNAIGIESKVLPGNLAYIAYSDGSEQYFIELEKTPKRSIDFPYEVEKSVDGLSERAALEMVKEYLSRIDDANQA